MSRPPRNPKIYHITHVDNLTDIAANGGLFSDAALLELGISPRSVGMSVIKRRRLEELDVTCHAGTKVGEYVPFYFCPRSVMLYVLYRGNHPELTYQGGQDPIVHLEADLHGVVRWADTNGVRWAFSLSNAGARYAEFRSRLDHLGDLDWDAIAARDFRDPDVKEGKQAEFLIHRFFPLSLVERIGTRTSSVQKRALHALSAARRHPLVEACPEWYF